MIPMGENAFIFRKGKGGIDKEGVEFRANRYDFQKWPLPWGKDFRDKILPKGFYKEVIMKKVSIFILSLCLTLFLGGMAKADSESVTYGVPDFEVQDIVVEGEYDAKTITLSYDDGVDDSPGDGWLLDLSHSYRVKFNPSPGKKIKVTNVKFYIADVSTAGDVNVLVQTGIDETYATGFVSISGPGWYEVAVSPKLKTDNFFFVVLKSAGFAGGGGDDLHPPIAGRSAHGYPGYWDPTHANFMVRAVGEQSAGKERKVAVLICGDTPHRAYEAVARGEGTWNGGYKNLQYVDSYQGYNEFWCDTVRMFHILIDQGGFHADNIYVLWGDGTDWNVSHPTEVADKYVPKYGTMTDYEANLSTVRMVLEGLANGNVTYSIPKMTERDSLFVWTFDHGSTGPGPDGAQSGDSLLCLMDGNMEDTEFADLLHAIPYRQAAVFMQQCYSGGFIDDVANGNTFIATACQGNQLAYRADDVNPDPDDVENETWPGFPTSHHGEFNYYFMNAFEWRSPLGTAVNANTQKPNKRISSTEAFNWEEGHESSSEIPQVRDDGGVGTKWILTWATTAEWTPAE